MPGILIVDDTAVDRRLAGGLLENDPSLDVSYAKDVSEALLQISNRLPDLVVTDLQMPEYDGLHLVNEINEKYPELPVVLITAHGSENIAAQALASGAASYVPKSDLANSLYETVMYVLSLSRAQSRNMKLMSCVQKSDFEFVLDNDIELIDPLIDMIQEIVGSLEILDQRCQVQLGVALENALTNAMFRGNLAMSREQFPVLSRNLIAERCKEEPWCDRRVHFYALITPEKVAITIRDEGDGFDTSQLPDASNPESFRDGIGRGLVLIQAFMDEVNFSDSGRLLEMSKFRLNAPATTPK
ncbi:ATP-binding response regulator [Mariniblastus fucicola]|uniref:Transcriptional regulatory protein DegU n=1 Tax=Mariniblastus fucicola TaxID=980251 RepID=A0A5B9P4S4_9BACT|nr:response regulator [Mariniblastus fucicola]QEG21284.1 Transcriptional regulatory protein DegU [Mariniblastus fucicola]